MTCSHNNMYILTEPKAVAKETNHTHKAWFSILGYKNMKLYTTGRYTTCIYTCQTYTQRYTQTYYISMIITHKET